MEGKSPSIEKIGKVFDSPKIREYRSHGKLFEKQPGRSRRIYKTYVDIFINSILNEGRKSMGKKEFMPFLGELNPHNPEAHEYLSRFDPEDFMHLLTNSNVVDFGGGRAMPPLQVYRDTIESISNWLVRNNKVTEKDMVEWAKK